MQEIKGKGLGKTDDMYWMWRFDSIREMADFANANPNKAKSDMRGNSDFNSTESFDAAYQLAVDGWHGIRHKVDSHLVPMREKLGSVLSVASERQHDLVGYEPDIDRFLSGELECMWDDVMVEAPCNGKVFTLVVDNSLTCQNTADEVIQRGAVLCALVEAYAMLGLQLEIWLESTLRGDKQGEYATFLCRVNSAGEPIDIDSMMFSLGNGDWFRRIQFAAGEHIPRMVKDYQHNERGCYGFARNGCHFADYLGASATVSLDGNRAMVEDGYNWIMQQLEAQGVIEDGKDY